MDWKSGLLGALGGGLGTGLLSGMFGGGKDPSGKAEEYLNAIPVYMQQFYQPYMQAGFGALPQLQSQYGRLTNAPSDVLNTIGAGYKQSPGFDFALKQALGAAGNAAAAGGMAGSPMHQQESMDIASGLASRDYDTWLQHALGLYGTGLQGEQGLYGMGFDASKNFADQLAQELAAQAQLGYAGQASRNQANSFGGILGGLGSLAGGMGKLFGSGMF